MLKRVLSASLILGLAFSGLAGPDRVALSLDYDEMKNWTYTMEYSSECRFSEKGSTSAKKTGVSCVLDGALTEKKDAIVFGVEDLKVESELYGDETKKDMVKKLTETKYTLPLENGYPAVEGLGDLSSEGLQEWNLYVQFAKLLPELPEQPAKRGFTWERSGRFEVHTAQGTVPCEVYRQFKVDRFSSDKDTAFISWQFRYSASDAVKDTSALLKYMPIAGKGKGTAAVHLADGYIVSASMDFETPVAKTGKAKVTWKETATIKHKPAK